MPLPIDIVCKCYRVTEAEIRSVLAGNAITEVEQVTEHCKAGGGCGGCHEAIEVLIVEALSA